MIRTLATWELLVLGAFALVVAEELITLLIARRKGLTRNVSRVLTFSSLLALALVYALLDLRWLRFDDSADGLQALRQLPTANWGYLLIGVMIALVLGYEVSALVQARRAGLTSTVSRLLALLIAVVLLLLLLGISQAKWNLYLDRLDSFYSESLAGDGS